MLCDRVHAGMKTFTGLRCAFLFGCAVMSPVIAADSAASTVPASAVPNPAPGRPVDLNTADIPTLEAVPEIGTSFANAVVASRPFKSVDELNRILRLSPEKFAEVRRKLTASAVQPTASPQPDPRTSLSKPAAVNEGKAISGQEVTERYDRKTKGAEKPRPEGK
jgi:hypothetical protein